MVSLITTDHLKLEETAWPHHLSQHDCVNFSYHDPKNSNFHRPVFISSNFNIIPNDLLSTMFKQKKGPLSQAQSDASLRLDGIDSGSFLRKSALPFTSRGQDTMAAAKRRSGVLRGRLLLLPPKPQLPPQEVERPAFFHVPNSEVRKRPALY